MVVNTGFSFGAKKAPLKPTNRRIVPTSPSGVTVVNLSGNALRNHSELAELRRKVASLGSDLSSAMNALAAANAEVDRLKNEKAAPRVSEDELNKAKAELNEAIAEVESLNNLKIVSDKELESLKAEIESLNSEYEKLSVENDNNKAKIAELISINEDLKARLENALKSKKKKFKGEPGISIEVSAAPEAQPTASEGEVQS